MKIDLATRLDDIEMSARARNGLANGGVTTVQNLIEMSESELRRVPNIGPISVAELKDILTRCGFALRADDSEAPVSSKLLQEIYALRDQVGHLHGEVFGLCELVKKEELSLRREIKGDIEGFRNRITRSDIEMAKVVQHAGEWVSTERSLEYRIQRIEEHLGLRQPTGAVIERQVIIDG